jgi:hypothetical protein
LEAKKMTEENQEEAGPEAAAVERAPPTNLQQLATHLAEGSLARKFILAREQCSESDEPIRKIIRLRLKELQEGYDPIVDQEN